MKADDSGGETPAQQRLRKARANLDAILAEMATMAEQPKSIIVQQMEDHNIRFWPAIDAFKAAVLARIHERAKTRR